MNDKNLAVNAMEDRVRHPLLMDLLASKHDVLAELLVGRDVNYIDIPMYGNIGDLLIMSGTLKFFQKKNINVVRKASYFNFDPRWVKPGELIVFQGGGNFGDLYPGPQQIRERTIEFCKNNRVIILPQTLRFVSDGAYAACRSVMRMHRDLHICVRDEKSYELAASMSPNVYLLPDMAHQLWPVLPNGACSNVQGKYLGILRADDEAAKGEDAQVAADLITDWPQLVGNREAFVRNVHRALRALHLLGIDRYLTSAASDLWILWANKLIGEAVSLYSGFEHLTTDRLHGHILACLMAKPNTLLDNSYGKNSTYADVWTAKSDIVKVVMRR